ncbi:MAG: hypothetical protein H6508_08275 [Calditrichaeota bacterium]|nr:hypothetical protein [Calditrichota bacterium]
MNLQYILKTRQVPTTRKAKRSTARIQLRIESLPIDYRSARDAFLVSYLSAALLTFDLNITQTAKALKVSRRTLQLQMNRIGIRITDIAASKCIAAQIIDAQQSNKEA